MRLGLGLGIVDTATRGGAADAPDLGEVSGAASLLSGETQGLALDFTDDFWQASTGYYGSAYVLDTGTPANDYDSHPYGLLTYSSPSSKLCLGPSGTYRYAAHNLYVNSAAPANQSITVVSGATYAITITGTVSVTASGAATGTWTAGTTTFTAATGTLTLGSTSGSGTVYVRRTPSDDVYLETGASPRYGIPFEWDVSGALQGIVIESAATNLFQYSNTVSNAYWGKGNVGTFVQNATGPDGLTSAWTMVVDSVGGVSNNVQFNKTGITVSTSTAYTLSIYAKAGTKSWLNIALAEFTTPSGVPRAYFNLATGALGTIDAGFSSASITHVGNGWYRCSVTFTTDAADTSGAVYFAMANGNGDLGITRDGTSTIYVSNAQLEAGSKATSPIVTPSSSTVTRAADVLGPALASFPWNAGSGAYEVDGVSASPTNNGSILTLAPRIGETYITTVKWVPA